jgi:hypothetical protein
MVQVLPTQQAPVGGCGQGFGEHSDVGPIQANRHCGGGPVIVQVPFGQQHAPRTPPKQGFGVQVVP